MQIEIGRSAGEKRFEDLLGKQRMLAQIVCDPFHREWVEKVTGQKDTLRYRYLASQDYRPEWLTENSAKVFLDIEGFLSDSGDPDHFGLAVTIDGRGEAFAWEREDFEDFISYILTFEEIVTFAGLGFDNWAIAKEIGKDDPRMQELYNKSFDLQQFANAISPIALRWNVSLHNFATNTIGEGKMGLAEYGITPKKIPEILRNGIEEDKEIIRQYCLHDAFLILKLYQFYNVSFQQKVKTLEVLVKDTALSLDGAKYYPGPVEYEVPACEPIDEYGNALRVEEPKRPGQFDRPLMEIITGVTEEQVEIPAVEILDED